MHTKFRFSTIPIIFLFIICFTADAQINIDTQRAHIVTPPEQMQDGWTIGSLQEEKVDAFVLSQLLDRIAEKEYQGIDGILIARNGKLIFEKYFPGYDFEYTAKDFRGKIKDYGPETSHNIASVTKNITSLLCGIAFDRKYIKNVDEKVYMFFQEDSSLFDVKKKDISVHHLLTMTSGLAWNEQDIGYGDLSNDIIQLFIVTDPLRYILSKPLSDDPGTRWYYNGGGTNLIGQIIQRTSGMALDQFAQKYLFEPLDIKFPKWTLIKPDFVYTSGDLSLTPREMAKIGSLVLHKGMWNGKRIISEAWVEQMTRQHVTLPESIGYGYHWWLQNYKVGDNEVNSYYAAGWGGQWIIVLPSLNAVIVLTGNNYMAADPTIDILNRYLLPSIIPSTTNQSRKK